MHRGRRLVSPALFIAAKRNFSYTSGVSESDKKPEPPVNFSAWQLAWELGYTIAVPIVILALVGRFADKQFDSAPWLLLGGIVLSVFISSALVYRKVRKLLD